MGMLVAARLPALARRALLCAALASALVLGFSTEAAVPESQIVLRGADSGSHLRISVRGGGARIVVDGLLSRARTKGCRHERRNRAFCPLRRVGRVVVVMGPSGDMVEVLQRLPVPLTAHLGGGSDKFIGNGERDTCFPEGARRNRCVGGPGDDICITGERNSDCVGGAGDDYCQHGAGSDGCWGGPGADVCRMGPGHDGCHGDGGRDRLYGGSSSDRLYGGGGRDYCDGTPGWGRSQGCERGPRR
jgi:Ca2+-binding RTX toxin-like protein